MTNDKQICLLYCFIMSLYSYGHLGMVAFDFFKLLPDIETFVTSLSPAPLKLYILSVECYNVLTPFCQLSRKLSLKFAALK